MVVTLPVSFAVTLAYFVMLYRFKNVIAKNHPEVWAQERQSARPLESWAQPAYRILKKTKSESGGDYRPSNEARKYAGITRKLLYIGAVAFFCFLFSSLALTFVAPMK